MSKFNNEIVKGVLKTNGTRFVNGEGEEVILHGYGVANWENVEGFMIGSAPLPMEKFKFILFPGPGQDHHHKGAVRQRYCQLCGYRQSLQDSSPFMQLFRHSRQDGGMCRGQGGER